MEREQQKQVIEALLFVSEEPVTIDRIATVLSTTPEVVDGVAGELQKDLAAAGRGLQVFKVAGGYQLGTIPEIAPYLEIAFSEDISSNLSDAALEALAIIAYKQPVTRIEIESIRGVRSKHVIDNLLKRKLIRISGRKEGPGRPILYSTSEDFLKYFGLAAIEELPELDFEQDGKTPAAGEDRFQPDRGEFPVGSNEDRSENPLNQEVENKRKPGE